jgi:putative peptide zinc metalloprotease protein
VDPKLREQQQVIEAAQGKVRAELDGIMQSRLRYAPIAPFAGRLFLSHPDLQTGAWVGKNERLGVLSDTSHWLVETYLPEAELDRIRTGDGGRFYSETPDVAALPVRVERIDRDATHVLPDPILASAHGGRFQVREHHRRLIPEAALYRVTLALESPHEPRVAQVLRGKVVLFGRPQSHADEFLRTAGAWLVREAGF